MIFDKQNIFKLNFKKMLVNKDLKELMELKENQASYFKNI